MIIAFEGDHPAPKVIIGQNDHLRESLDFFRGRFRHNSGIGAVKSLIRSKMIIPADFPNSQK